MEIKGGKRTFGVSLSFSLMNLMIPVLLLMFGCTAKGVNHSKGKTNTGMDHKIYNAAGKQVTFDTMADSIQDADVVFIGETHNNPAAHHLEERLLKTLHTKLTGTSHSGEKSNIILSLEFFEKDVQVVLDEYLDGLITERHFKDSTRTWPNYSRAYRPLVEYAKENAIPVVAANTPRRYVNRVARLGRESLDTLSDTAKSWLPPLPYGEVSESYKTKLEEYTRSMKETFSQKPGKQHGKKTTLPPEKSKKIMEKMKAKAHAIDYNAQALWDAGMAWSITRALKNSPSNLVININGSFHSEGGLGIPEHLKRYSPGLNTVIITIKPSETFYNDEHKPVQGDDFTIVTPSAN